MEHQIPQSFKVQWLNTTLKFIKDDTQLIQNYPEMPSSHVEYLHNLIWQRKNDLGLGFKSLYAPVWEAMEIYSVKYQFKFIVEISEDGGSGYLKMEKIPKTDQSAKKLNDEKKDIENKDERKEKENRTIQDNEVSKKVQTETVKCKQQDLQSSKKTKNKKPLPKISKSLKMFMENQKLLDSLSPLFMKEKLKSIRDFISDESSASEMFFNLAPMESRFLENFSSIYQRKNDLGVLLSPACNEILDEISKCYEKFSQTCNLDITVKVNGNTNKREVKYTKVPVFLSKKNSKNKLKENSIQTNSTNPSINETTKLVNMPSVSKPSFCKILEKKNVSKTKKSKSKNKATNLEISVTGEDRIVINKPIDKVIETIDNNIIEASSRVIKTSDDVKPKTTNYLKDTSLNKSEPLPKMSINFTKEGTSNTIDTTHIKITHKCPKMKILKDMSVPLTSNKGLRMMQLMGWKGGALGLRGEGIIEPIIPIPNYNSSGLGHVPFKTESNKEIKKITRFELVNKVLDMIDNDIKVSVIKLDDIPTKREIKFLNLTIKIINKRLNLSVEFQNRVEIKDKMIRNPDIIFDIDFEDDNRKIILTKTTKKEIKKIGEDIKKETNLEDNDIDKELRNKNNEASFKTIVLKSILELIKSEDREKVIQFNKELKTKHINHTDTIILSINDRQNIKHKKSQVVAELAAKVLEEIGDIQLSFKIYESERYILIRKKHPKINKDINKTVVNITEHDENKSAFDNVRRTLPTKKKCKLLNALYKYEMEYAEECKENQWYNTEDKSLLDTKTIDNNKTKIENSIHKNKQQNIEHDQNNNGDIAINVKIVYETDNPGKIVQKTDVLLQAFAKVREN